MKNERKKEKNGGEEREEKNKRREGRGEVFKKPLYLSKELELFWESAKKLNGKFRSLKIHQYS